MNRPQHDLVSIANPRLASELKVKAAKQFEERHSEESLDTLLLDHKELREQTWRAILVLNIVRYAFAIFLLVDIAIDLNITAAHTELSEHVPRVFLAATFTLLMSAIVFSYLSRTQKYEIERILATQFVIDLILTTTLIHISGASSNDWFFVYFVIVTTGSVALTRRHALALASAAFLLIAIEQIDVLLVHDGGSNLSLEALSGRGAILLISALLISWMAYLIRKNQIQGYVPGDESLEAYLIREEIKAIETTLHKTNGNKTNAAALLGRSFRSFRYKLSKYGLE